MFFSPKFRYKDETWCITLINGSIFSPQGVTCRHFFTFKAFKKCLPPFHSTQFSLWQCFSMSLSYFNENQKFYCSLAKIISRCLTSIQCFTIIDDLIMISQYHVHIILITALYIYYFPLNAAGKFFKHPLIVVYRRTSNLRDILVKAKLPTITTPNNTSLPPGSFRCGQDCATCMSLRY